MLHLTLAANLLNAVGGSPDLTAPGFVPTFPAYLPDGENDFIVGLGPFSPELIDTFCKIERPAEAPDERTRLVQSRKSVPLLGASPIAPGMHYFSIGEFYAEIDRGLCWLSEEQGDALFCGDPGRQVTGDYYYSGGGGIVPVTDLASARAAVSLISEQGEGYRGGIYAESSELAHYYRFQQIKLNQYYLPGDKPDAPTGPGLTVDWKAVYPIKPNAHLSDYPEGSDLAAAAREFNTAYGGLLHLLTRAFNGSPRLLLDAVWDMFRLRDKAARLVHNPINGRDGVHAAPTFEIPGVPRNPA
jgi:hypothetical protein